MNLTPGTALGPFEILTRLGGGNMGDVWKARDSRLSRFVAIKVLRGEPDPDSSRLKRLEREARAICALSHPNVVTLFEVGREGQTPYLVMELVEGRTLRDVLLAGPLPLKEALRIGSQIAEGLAKAHEAGIVHRDLKPENVMITADGHVKILDFGLVRLEAIRERGEPAPTISWDTEAGAVLGTVGYMSPEQAKGELADYRCDQFALGSILYEMATGRRAFQRDTPAQTLAAVIEAEPAPPASASPETPPPLSWVIERCLSKDRKNRYASTRDLARDLADGLARVSGGADRPVVVRAHTGPWLSRFGWAALALLGAGLLALVVHRPTPSPRLIRSSLLLPERLLLNSFSLSPDGTRLAVSARDGNGLGSLWVRPIDSDSAKRLAGTENAVLPFWSPDSGSVGFFTEGKLSRVEVSGGPATTICSTSGMGVGGSWSRAGVIVFGTTSGPIYRVPASGGTPVPITKLDTSAHETTHRWPRFLPDGRHFLFVSVDMALRPENPANRLRVASLESAETPSLMPSSSNAAYDSGYLLFSRGGSLMARRFDPDRLRVEGEAVSIARPVRDSTDWSHLASFSVSETGALVFEEDPLPSARLVWLDRTGKEIGTVVERDALAGTRLSPDGLRVAQVIFNPDSRAREIWIYDLERGGRRKLVASDFDSVQPVWSPDGKNLLFGSDRRGSGDVFRKPVDGSTSEELVLATDADERPRDWSPDGRYIVFDSRAARGDRMVVLSALPIGGGAAFPLLQRGRRTGDARFSPDGHWIAYSAEEAGRIEVFVAEFPRAATRWPISTEGGSSPRWRADGKELFYFSPDGRVLAVDVALTPSFKAGAPRVLFDTRRPTPSGGSNQYEVSADGQRFLFVQHDAERKPVLTLLLNWTGALKR